MAENKKSVLLYCDLIHVVEGLSNEEAGALFKHYLRYINDLNPCAEDRLTALLFEPIKQTLKRDLKKWEDKSLKNSENAKMRWHANASEGMPTDANHADKVIDKVIDKDIKYKFEQALIDYGFIKSLVKDWLVVRKKKKASNTETAFNGFIKQVELAEMDKNEILKICVERSWSGLDHAWLKEIKQTINVTTSQPLVR